MRPICAAALATCIGIATSPAAATADLQVAVLGLTTADAAPAARQYRLDSEEWPNDPLYPMQWSLHPAAQAADTDAEGQSARIDGKQLSRIVVAVLDSGFLLSHEDLQFLPGYDFVSTAEVANDGDGRDADPTDPGDWVETASSGCHAQPSSWHGTRVAGVIGARTSNHIGIAAANSHVDLLPVRVTGTCGGYVQDLIDGLRWAAGLSVAGAPDNPHPASVINVSLGFTGRCPGPLQQAINEVTQAGAIVVTASTNSAADLDEIPHAPASCGQILTAGASTRAGHLASYSAYGSALDVLAPGGDAADGILTTDNAGDTVAYDGAEYNRHYGTSLAGARLSAAVTMLKATSPALTVGQIRTLIRSTAIPLDQSTGCDFMACGGGLLNTAAALAQLRDSPIDDSSVEPQTPIASATAGPAGDGAGLTLWVGLAPLLWIARARRRRISQ